MHQAPPFGPTSTEDLWIATDEDKISLKTPGDREREHFSSATVSKATFNASTLDHDALDESPPDDTKIAPEDHRYEEIVRLPTTLSKATPLKNDMLNGLNLYFSRLSTLQSSMLRLGVTVTKKSRRTIFKNHY